MFNVYPNPSRGLIEINYTHHTAEEVTLFITNNKGQKVHTEKFIWVPSEESKQVNLSQYPKGIYFVQINTGSASEVRKIILE